MRVETNISGRTLTALVLAGALACHGDSKMASPPVPPPPVVDTMPQDLSKVQTSLPPPAPVPSAPQAHHVAADTETLPNYPAAPQPITDAVTRAQSMTRFCYQEYGQKADPNLRGRIAATVSVASNEITNVSIVQSSWSVPEAGTPVNDCIASRAKQAWRLDPGSTVASGVYLVQLNFKGQGEN